MKFDVVSISSNLKKAREEAVSTKAELYTLSVAAEFATKKHYVVLAKRRELRQDKVKVWKATRSRSEATSANLREEISIVASKLHSERDSAAAHHYKLLASIRFVVKAREEQKHKAADTFVKLRKTYDD